MTKRRYKASHFNCCMLCYIYLPVWKTCTKWPPLEVETMSSSGVVIKLCQFPLVVSIRNRLSRIRPRAIAASPSLQLHSFWQKRLAPQVSVVLAVVVVVVIVVVVVVVVVVVGGGGVVVVVVATRIITILVGDPCKPVFATVTGRRPNFLWRVEPGDYPLIPSGTELPRPRHQQSSKALAFLVCPSEWRVEARFRENSWVREGDLVLYIYIYAWWYYISILYVWGISGEDADESKVLSVWLYFLATSFVVRPFLRGFGDRADML